MHCSCYKSFCLQCYLVAFKYSSSHGCVNQTFQSVIQPEGKTAPSCIVSCLKTKLDILFMIDSNTLCQVNYFLDWIKREEIKERAESPCPLIII